MYVRRQATPSTALLGAESGIYTPKLTCPTLPTYRRLDDEDVPTVALTHLPHPPLSSAGFPRSPVAVVTSTPRTPLTPSPHAASVAAPSRPHAARDLFVCPEVHCGKTFPRSFALRRHMRIHTGTKPYACDYDGCVQRFNTSGNLSRHKRIHSGERPYPCDFHTCGKRFNTSTKLKRHMRIHFPDGQNRFRCTHLDCAWACDNYKEYVQHQKLHGLVLQSENGHATRNHVHETLPRGRTMQNQLPAPIEAIPSNADARHFEFSQSSESGNTNEEFSYDRNRMYANGHLTIRKEPLDHREEPFTRRMSSGPGLPSKACPDDRIPFQAQSRLPFPARAFPLETGLLGSSMHPLPLLPPTSLHRYYDTTTASASAEISSSDCASYSYTSTHAPYASYQRSGESNMLVNSYQSPSTTTTFISTSESPYTRQIDSSQQYESSSPHDVHQPHSASARRQPQAPPGYENNTVPAEFTGEELSAVFELMKDS